MLRPLVAAATSSPWSEVRRRNREWLLKWEPMRIPGTPDPATDREAFAVALQRSRARAPARRRLRVRHLRRRQVRRRDQPQRRCSAARSRTRTSATGSTRRTRGQGYTPEAVVVVLRVRLRGARPAPPADRDHPAQQGEPPRRREARHPRGGHRAALPRDQRRVGGPRPLRHDRRGVGEASRRTPRRVDVERRSALRRDLGLQRGETLAEPRLLRRPHLRRELATHRLVV